MKVLYRAIIVSLFILANSAYSAEVFTLKLVNSLDEPEFYCLDVTGHGASTRIEDPLQVHTCKASVAVDQAFERLGETFKMPEYDLCLTASASGDTPLVGSALMIRPCDGRATQNFHQLASGQIVPSTRSNLCLAAGQESLEAAGPSHMWRVASLQECNSTDKRLTTWTTQ